MNAKRQMRARTGRPVIYSWQWFGGRFREVLCRWVNRPWAHRPWTTSVGILIVGVLLVLSGILMITTWFPHLDATAALDRLKVGVVVLGRSARRQPIPLSTGTRLGHA